MRTENGNQPVERHPIDTSLANFWALVGMVVVGGLVWEVVLPGAEGYVRGTWCYVAGCLFTGRYFARSAGPEKAASLERWLRFFLQFLAVPAFAAGLLIVLIGRSVFFGMVVR